MKRLILTAALFLAAAPALAAPITVEKAWVRPAAKGLPTSAAYFIVRNSGPADSLQAVSTPAGRASLHMSMAHDGMMMMHAMTAVPVPAKGAMTFAPGGYHVMIEGLKAPLVAGQKTPLTLSFTNAGRVTVQAEVRPTAP